MDDIEVPGYPETVWISTWQLELAYSCGDESEESCWIVFAVLETVYIADIHGKWSNLAISRLSRDVSGYSNWHNVTIWRSSRRKETPQIGEVVAE